MKRYLIRLRSAHIVFFLGTHAVLNRLIIDIGQSSFNNFFYFGSISTLAIIVILTFITNYSYNRRVTKEGGRILGMYWVGLAKFIPIFVLAFGTVWIKLGIQAQEYSLIIVGVSSWIILSPTFLILVGYTMMDFGDDILAHNCYFSRQFDKSKMYSKKLFSGWHLIRYNGKFFFSYVDYENRSSIV